MVETHKITVPNSKKYLEISQDFLIKPMRDGIMIPFPVTPFELNKSKLRIGSDIFLQGILQALKQNENVKVELVSFPDAVGQIKEFSGITSERANSIKNWLVENGVGADRLTTKGESAVDPKNPPPTSKAAKGKRYIGPCYYKIVGV
jgi:outer membrane protein OmpA-like peptidoglycan-associated protein